MSAELNSVCFNLNGEKVIVRDVAPTTTLLDYLRDVRSLTGTKEGCAEGDCGACTVTLASPASGGVIHRAVNACIQFLPMLEGQAITTVEAIGTSGKLHPCQQAMVDHHGSQCGFCTPGIVMSLHTAYLSRADISRSEAADLLAGNLCRCTGYGPIIDSACSMFSVRSTVALETVIAEEARALESVQRTGCLVIRHGLQQFFSPDSLDDLLTLADRHPHAVILAGATDVGLWVTKQKRVLDTIICLGRVAELKVISVSDFAIDVGAGVTYDQLMQVPELPDELTRLMRRIGGQQVRQAGTIGGNIANGSPIGDMPPALIALGARITLASGHDRRDMALEDFFQSYGKQDRRPGDVLVSISIPRPASGDHLGFYKISKRFDQDISTLCGCFALTITDGKITSARIAFGGMAGIPKRASHVEAVLTGLEWSEDSVRKAQSAFGDDFQPLTDLRGSAGYRLGVAQNLLWRFYLESTGQIAPTDRLELGQLNLAGAS